MNHSGKGHALLWAYSQAKQSNVMQRGRRVGSGIRLIMFGEQDVVDGEEG